MNFISNGKNSLVVMEPLQPSKLRAKVGVGDYTTDIRHGIDPIQSVSS